MRSIGSILSKSYLVKGRYIIKNGYRDPGQSQAQPKIYELSVKEAMDRNRQLAALGAAERYVLFTPENRDSLSTQQIINDAQITGTPKSPPETGSKMD